jgi:hypothetical protein
MKSFELVNSFHVLLSFDRRVLEISVFDVKVYLSNLVAVELLIGIATLPIHACD